MVKTRLMPEYVVKNGNGATLGGYTSYTDAKRCRDIWRERYDSCGIDVTVKIVERKLHVA